MADLQGGGLRYIGIELRSKFGQVVGEDGGLVAGAGDGDVAEAGVFGSGLAMRELIASDDNGDQTGNLRNCAGEQGLHCGEPGIERRLRQGKRRKQDQYGVGGF